MNKEKNKKALESNEPELFFQAISKELLNEGKKGSVSAVKLNSLHLRGRIATIALTQQEAKDYIQTEVHSDFMPELIEIGLQPRVNLKRLFELVATGKLAPVETTPLIEYKTFIYNYLNTPFCAFNSLFDANLHDMELVSEMFDLAESGNFSIAISPFTLRQKRDYSWHIFLDSLCVGVSSFILSSLKDTKVTLISSVDTERDIIFRLIETQIEQAISSNPFLKERSCKYDLQGLSTGGCGWELSSALENNREGRNLILIDSNLHSIRTVELVAVPLVKSDVNPSDTTIVFY